MLSFNANLLHFKVILKRTFYNKKYTFVKNSKFRLSLLLYQPVSYRSVLLGQKQGPAEWWRTGRQEGIQTVNLQKIRLIKML